ncbi:MAG: HD domain-containing protein [Candidatus Aminicenantes bacterium]|nr:HD domain-containing protein [Candidatus Aminicenantes bacterium]
MITSQLNKEDIYEKQLEKYAADFVDIYQSEKQKREELESANLQISKYADDLKCTLSDLEIAHRQLQESYLDTIHRLVMAAEFRDDDTAKHIVRIGKYCELMGTEISLPPDHVRNLFNAAPMHDIGKIGIPDLILNKPGKLTVAEFEVIKTHTTIGASLLRGSKSEILQLGEVIALSHHEKWDGNGYPYGLKGKDIPIEGRIVAVADVFDALTSERRYKKAFTIEVSLNILKEERGKHFDPEIIDVFFDNIDRILNIKEFVDKEKEN